MIEVQSRKVFSLLIFVVVLFGSVPPTTAQSKAPLPAGVAVGWSHAPFEMGECGLCHTGDDAANPGPVEGEVSQICFGCHLETQEAMDGARVAHYAAEEDCTNCHNPHNAADRRLLVADSPEICIECHDDIWNEATNGLVQHLSVQTGQACLSCHSPHASDVDNLLKGYAYDLCVECHAETGILDEKGKQLTDFGELLANNPVVHGPVAARDCSACHTPHGGNLFRLLVTEYPEKFYAPFDPKTYELCFSCHNEDVVTAEYTTTLTGFRDGDRNLHFVHVNKQDRGRTCRACHEVHAAPQTHLIRNGVPYGKSGWVLKINYTGNDNGGSCEKTCHGALTYDRTKGAAGGETGK